MVLRLSNLICGLMITMGLVLQPSSASGGFVNIMAGYDLLVTDSASFDFDGIGPLLPIPFVGVPLGTFNFGAGSVNTGATDTIVHRSEPVTNLADGASQTINIQMAALYLQTQNQINWGALAPGGNANEYVKTVNVQDLGSTMTITNSVANVVDPLLEYGTFDSIIKIKFQLQGVTSLVTTGFIEKTFTQTGADWSHIPGISVPLLINSVNSNLNGSNHLNDFFLSGLATHDAGDGTHVVGVPEPTSMFAIGLACMAVGGGFARRRRLQQAS